MRHYRIRDSIASITPSHDRRGHINIRSTSGYVLFSPSGTRAQTMILQDIVEIELVGTFDRGVANKERIVFRACEDVALGQFGIILGINLSNGVARPIRDNFFWFGDGTVRKDDWICVFTGAGRPSATDVPGTENKMFSVFWGRKAVVLTSTMIVPILFRFDAVFVEQPTPQLPDERLQAPQDNSTSPTT
jgi:hypothetical protein